jgi:hypothetical protein
VATVIMPRSLYYSGVDYGGWNWPPFFRHHLQQQEEHRVFADLIGKGRHIRTVTISDL